MEEQTGPLSAKRQSKIGGRTSLELLEDLYATAIAFVFLLATSHGHFIHDQLLNCCPYRWLHFLELYMNGILQYALFVVWLLLLGI